ncbi:MAG: TlpA family protein disulfide reductase [Acidimicrobiia bacterium]|nr:TlpA family protein disulfide reductase [Acidimicrobiia bacterium]
MATKRRRGGILLGALALAIVAAVSVGKVLNSDDNGDLVIDSGPARTRVPGVAATGSPAPAIDLPSLTGSTRVRLADHTGEPVIVNFFASYCVPCRKEFPVLRALHDAHPGVTIIGVSYKDIPSDARNFARDHDANWILANGGDNDPAGRAYGVRAIPQTFFIDRDGIIRARAFGLPSSAGLEKAVATISKK